jgi:uncharacterized membrane protein YfcA
MLIALLAALAVVTVVYAVCLLRSAIASRATPRLEAVVLGAVTNFFDTLGIGSFAPTMAWFRLRKLVPDQLIPGTMLVGHTLPAMTQAVIFLVLLGVLVDPLLLTGCVVAVVAGALLGAPLVCKTRVWIVQSIVGLALLVAATFYILSNLGLMPVGGTAAALPLPLMIVAIGANFVFGVLLNFGVGNYAPTLAMLSLMGMDPRLSFPIMAGGAALAGASASVRHISIGKIDLRIALGLCVGGIPAVLVAAFVVKAMPVEFLRWLVTIVVVYAAAVILIAAARGRREQRLETKAAPGQDVA